MLQGGCKYTVFGHTFCNILHILYIYIFSTLKIEGGEGRVPTCKGQPYQEEKVTVIPKASKRHTWTHLCPPVSTQAPFLGHSLACVWSAAKATLPRLESVLQRTTFKILLALPGPLGEIICLPQIFLNQWYYTRQLCQAGHMKLKGISFLLSTVDTLSNEMGLFQKEVTTHLSLLLKCIDNSI